jgi:thiamine biosynthesis lipoprotein
VASNPTNFHHTAMATDFEFRIRHPNPDYARQAAAAVRDEIDRVEALISPFNDSSDIARVNASPPGETILRVSSETHALLLSALELQRHTAGAVNIPLGRVTALLRAGNNHAPAAPPRAPDNPPPPRGDTPALVLDPVHPLVQKPSAPDFALDPGAIGKGFALDLAARLLAEWEIRDALLNAGGSSLLALGSPSPAQRAWPVSLLADSPRQPAAVRVPLRLRDRALGASGTSQQGAHIFNPRAGNTSLLHHRAWFLAPDAATADALATAAMTMTHGELSALLRQLPPGHAALTEARETHALHLLTRDAPARPVLPGETLECP